MKKASILRRVRWVAILSCCASTVFSGQFDELFSKVPSSANTLVLVDVESVLASPAGKKEDWKTRHDKSYAAGLTFLPPDTKAAILAAQYDLELMVPVWTTAVMTLDHEPSLPGIQRLTGGSPDQLGKYSAVMLPGDAYIVKFGPSLVAAMAPANRQSAGRWIREADAGAKHSPYLNEAFRFANDIGTPIILAIDLQDVATEETIREALKASEKYAAAKNLDTLVKFLMGIRGVTLGITLQTDQPFGKVKVDFSDDVPVSAEEGKAMLLHALSERGAMLEELVDWTPNVAGKQITLEGTLTASGVKRLSSLFDRPPAFRSDAQSSENQRNDQSNQQQQVVQKSQEYFHRINDLIDDLKKEKKKNSVYTTGSIAVWCDTYARRIDQLSVVGVDPELATFGDQMSDALRGASSAIKSSNARKRIKQVNTQMTYDYYTYGTTYGSAYRPGFYGGYTDVFGDYGTYAVPNTTAYQHERTRVSAEERVTGLNQARDVFAQIEEATGDIRRKMEQKYSANF